LSLAGTVSPSSSDAFEFISFFLPLVFFIAYTSVQLLEFHPNLTPALFPSSLVSFFLRFFLFFSLSSSLFPFFFCSQLFSQFSHRFISHKISPDNIRAITLRLSGLSRPCSLCSLAHPPNHLRKYGAPLTFFSSARHTIVDSALNIGPLHPPPHHDLSRFDGRRSDFHWHSTLVA